MENEQVETMKALQPLSRAHPVEMTKNSSKSEGPRRSPLSRVIGSFIGMGIVGFCFGIGLMGLHSDPRPAGAHASC